MKALTDLQAKGDLLVKEITKQKQTLDDLQSKIRSSESNLTKVNTMIDSKESFLSRLQIKILQSQKDFTELGETDRGKIFYLIWYTRRFGIEKEKNITRSRVWKTDPTNGNVAKRDRRWGNSFSKNDREQTEGWWGAPGSEVIIDQSGAGISSLDQSGTRRTRRERGWRRSGARWPR